jgi:hypothetical protein
LINIRTARRIVYSSKFYISRWLAEKLLNRSAIYKQQINKQIDAFKQVINISRSNYSFIKSCRKSSENHISISIIPAIEGYIGYCHSENSTVVWGVVRGQQCNSKDDYLQCTPLLQADLLYYTECRKVKSYCKNRRFTLNQSLPFNVLQIFAFKYKRSNDVV